MDGTVYPSINMVGCWCWYMMGTFFLPLTRYSHFYKMVFFKYLSFIYLMGLGKAYFLCKLKHSNTHTHRRQIKALTTSVIHKSFLWKSIVPPIISLVQVFHWLQMMGAVGSASSEVYATGTYILKKMFNKIMSKLERVRKKWLISTWVCGRNSPNLHFFPAR